MFKPTEVTKKNRILQEQDSNSTIDGESDQLSLEEQKNKNKAEVYMEQLKISSSSKLEIVCLKGNSVCERNTFIFYPEVNHAKYKLEIELDTGMMIGDINSMSFSAVTANSKYTMFLLLLRYSLFIISVLLGTRYLKLYWAMNNFVKTFEHKAICWLSILLIFFNDPFYAATILKANLFFAFLSTLFVCTFITTLVIFWIVMVQRIHQEHATPETKIIKSKTTIVLGKKDIILLHNNLRIQNFNPISVIIY